MKRMLPSLAILIVASILLYIGYSTDPHEGVPTVTFIAGGLLFFIGGILFLLDLAKMHK